MTESPKYSISAKLPSMFHGLAEGTAMIKFFENFMAIEYRMTDGLVGIWQGKVKKITIAYEKIQTIKAQKKWFVHKLVIALNAMDILSEHNIGKGAQLEFSVKKNDFKDLQYAVSYIQLYLSEKKLKHFEE